MDRSLAFYHDAFGMEVPPLPESGERPYNPTNAQLYAMFDIPGAKERHQSAHIPGTDVRLELMEVQNVDHRTIPLRLQDPGAMTLVFVVRNIATALERAKQAEATVITPGGAPVTRADGGKSILIRDLDGRYIELRQFIAEQRLVGAPQTDTNVAGMRLSISVNDVARTLEIYRDVLGFLVESNANLGADQYLRTLTGLPTAEFRRSVVQGPGAKLWIEFVEYRGVDRKPLDMRIQDRGAARLQLRADHAETLVSAMRDAGLHVVSQGGFAVPIPPNFKGALVADPNGFFLTPFAPCDGCAPGLQRELH
jgi:catechol 2,3-dioxygenase-like lactoylglutathione lyase family enzyme